MKELEDLTLEELLKWTLFYLKAEYGKLQAEYEEVKDQETRRNMAKHVSKMNQSIADLEDNLVLVSGSADIM